MASRLQYKDIRQSLPKQARSQRVTVKGEINNVRNFAANGRSSPGAINTNYPFFRYLQSRLKRPTRHH